MNLYSLCLVIYLCYSRDVLHIDGENLNLLLFLMLLHNNNIKHFQARQLVTDQIHR